MTPIEQMTDEQFEKHTLAILERELGPLGMARYLRMHPFNTSDYTQDRHKWLGHLTVAEIVDQVRELREQNERSV